MSRGKSAEKKKPARVAAGPQAPGFARSVGESTGRIIRPVIPLLVFLMVFCGVSLALWYPVRGDALGLSGTKKTGPAGRGRLTTREIRRAVLEKSSPPWVYRQELERVANLGLFAENRSVFDPNLSHELARAYEASPWVERVQSVRLHFPAHLEVEINWRKPMASVPQSSMVLDRNGVVLNLNWNSPEAKDIPRISSVLCGRTEVGKLVPEKELLDALALLAVVRDALAFSPGNLKVADIIREPAGTWRVLTDRGPLVYWGFFTDDPPMDEPRTREKADLLRRRLCESKDPSTLEHIKVCFANAPFKPRGAATGGSAASLATKR